MNWRRKVQQSVNSIVNHFGLELRAAARNELPRNLPDAEAYTGPEDFSRLFRPWRAPGARTFLTPEVLENTMLSTQKLYFLERMFKGTLTLEREVFEAGTGSGGSSRLMLNSQKRNGSRKPMWLLDTFEGYKKVDREKDGEHVAVNDCRCKSYEDVQALLSDAEVPCHLIKGMIPETLQQVHADKLCFAHIDVNLYEPTFAATEFCLKRLVPGGVIVFDDYCWPLTYGARCAIDEVCAKFKQVVVSLPESTQAFLIKRNE